MDKKPQAKPAQDSNRRGLELGELGSTDAASVQQWANVRWADFLLVGGFLCGEATNG